MTDLPPPDEFPTLPGTPRAIAGLTCIVREVTDGDTLVDCFSDLSSADCAFLLSEDKEAVGQYLERLTPLKIATILSSGLGLFVISECAAPGWEPTEASGEAKGIEIVTRARVLDIPVELPMVVDYEDPAVTTTEDDATAWLDAVGRRVLGAGHPAELYVGYRPILSGIRLYERPAYTRYYASSPYSPTLPCGYAIVQHAWNVKLGHLLVDLDRAKADSHRPPRRALAMFKA